MNFAYNETLEQARDRNIRDALYEDIGRGDWTAQLVQAGRRVQARVIVREAAVRGSTAASRPSIRPRRWNGATPKART